MLFEYLTTCIRHDDALEKHNTLSAVGNKAESQVPYGRTSKQISSHRRSCRFQGERAESATLENLKTDTDFEGWDVSLLGQPQ